MTASGVDPFLKDQALLYVSGCLSDQEKEEFETLLQCETRIQDFTGSISETVAFLTLRTTHTAPTSLKERVLSVVTALPQVREKALVLSNSEGRVRWVNTAFSRMCGYSLEELVNRKLGPLLQGEKTDRATAHRIRQAIRLAATCRESILNYHKDGTPYWVEIDLFPIRDGQGNPLYFVAQETERPDLVLP